MKFILIFKTLLLLYIHSNMICNCKSNSYFFINNTSSYLEFNTKHQPKHISEYFPLSSYKHSYSHYINNYSPLWNTNNNKYKNSKLETPTFTTNLPKHHFIFPKPSPQSPYNIITSKQNNSSSSKRITPIEIPPLTISKSLYYDNTPSFPHDPFPNTTTTIKHTHYKIKPKHILYKLYYN